MVARMACGSGSARGVERSASSAVATITLGVSTSVPSRSKITASSTQALYLPGAAGSPEIARRQGERVLQGPEAVSLDAGHPVVLLQPAFDDEQRAAQHGAAVLLEGGRVDDDVGDPRLVLEGEEDESLRGAGP